MNSYPTKGASAEIPTKRRRRAVCVVASLENIGDAFIALVESEYLVRLGRYSLGVDIAPWLQKKRGCPVSSTACGVIVLPIRHDLLRFVRRCVGSDIFIGGGNMIRLEVSGSWLTMLLAGCIAARLTNGTVRVVGSGATHIKRGVKKCLWYGVLGLAERIQLRDRASACLVSADFATIRRGVSVTSDVAFLFQVPTPDPVKCASGTLLIAIGIDPYESRSVSNSIVVEIARLCHSLGHIDRIDVVVHEPRPGHEGHQSQKLSTMLRAELGLPANVIVPEDTVALLRCYHDATIVVTNRLHSLIIAALHHLPVLCLLDKTRKMLSFAHDLGYPGTMSESSPQLETDLKVMRNYLATFDREDVKRLVMPLRESARVNFADLEP